MEPTRQRCVDQCRVCRVQWNSLLGIWETIAYSRLNGYFHLNTFSTQSVEYFQYVCRALASPTKANIYIYIPLLYIHIISFFHRIGLFLCSLYIFQQPLGLIKIIIHNNGPIFSDISLLNVIFNCQVRLYKYIISQPWHKNSNW